MTIILIVLVSTFGVYYMGKWNPTELGISPNEQPNMIKTYVSGFLNTLILIMTLILLGLLCYGLYSLYNHLVKNFS